ncbi:MAG: pirin family protein [Myxococcota bacterium]
MTDLDRRRTLKMMAAAGAATAAGCSVAEPAAKPGAGGPGEPQAAPVAAASGAVLRVAALGPQWQTSDPFLFCAHHDDRYPAGNEALGPAAPLTGRRIGQDFAGVDGWRMYHGEVVPGFPRHPHRGFETVTVVRTGLLDHSDSLGARARYGGGDVQWMTAGKGILHAEMFPLLNREGENPLELFQIWLNLPAADKLVAPVFEMLWDNTIPRVREQDSEGRATTVTMVAGRYASKAPPSPPSNSWAARSDSDVAIWTIKLDANAQWTLPAASVGTERSLYFFEGSGLQVAAQTIPDYHRVVVSPDAPVQLRAGPSGAELLLLQGRPIGEPIARQGPFVMNTQDEIRQAFADYRATGFGSWPWGGSDPVHGAAEGRFAQPADGRVDTPV